MVTTRCSSVCSISGSSSSSRIASGSTPGIGVGVGRSVSPGHAPAGPQREQAAAAISGLREGAAYVQPSSRPSGGTEALPAEERVLDRTPLRGGGAEEKPGAAVRRRMHRTPELRHAAPNCSFKAYSLSALKDSWEAPASNKGPGVYLDMGVTFGAKKTKNNANESLKSAHWCPFAVGDHSFLLSFILRA